MNRPGGTPGAGTLGTFGITVLLGAGNFIGVGFSNQELAPFWGAFLRFGLAAAVFVVFALVRRLRWPRGRVLRLTVLYGILGTGVFYALGYWARLQVSAGVATVIMAVVPLATIILATLQGLERWRLRSLAGAVLAAAGIAWMAVGPDAVSLPVGALLAMLGSAVAVAQSIIIGKRIAGNHPAVTNAISMATGAVMLFALSAGVGESWAVPRKASTLLALAYLTALGTIGLFVLILLVVRRWTASATSYMFVLFPVVTMILDAALFGEPLTVEGVVGAVVVMAGVWFGALSPGIRRTRPEPGAIEPETAANEPEPAAVAAAEGGVPAA